jgi:hypothetical protein
MLPDSFGWVLRLAFAGFSAAAQHIGCRFGFTTDHKRRMRTPGDSDSYSQSKHQYQTSGQADKLDNPRRVGVN